MQKNNIQNKVVIITGGSNGIGLESAKMLLDQGAKLVLSSRNDVEFYINKGSLSLEILENNNLVYKKCNVKNEKDINELFEFAMQNYGRADILINNAGIAEFGSFAEMKTYDFDNQNDILYRGTFLGTKAFLPQMLEQKFGMIVNIISVAAIKTFGMVAGYSGAKAAVLAMSRSLREEVRKQGIKVLNFIPGATNTEIWDKSVTDEHGNRMLSAREVAEILVANINIGLNENVMIEEIIVKPQFGDL